MIRFFHENFLTLDETHISEWLIEIAKQYGYSIQQMDYNFVDATTLLELNQKHLNHDTDTDILTFDYTVDTKITAEAFISREALIENAKKYNQSAEKETLRLVSHALLHCMGQNDKSEDEKLTMQRKEDACLAMFHVKQ